MHLYYCREELILITLSPRLSEDNVNLVMDTLYIAMQQSLSLLKSFESTEIFKRVDLFSSLLFFISTRFTEAKTVDLCLQKIQEALLNELHHSYGGVKNDRFPPSYIGLLLIYYDLCRYFDVIEMFKFIFYNIFIKAGEFPIRIVYFLYMHDATAFQEQSTCDSVILSIIGETLSSHSNQLQDYNDLIHYFGSMNRSWTLELESLEASSLQYILDYEHYSTENPQYIEAGRVLVLLYVYRGGLYAVNSLISNGIIQHVENHEISSPYRTFLIYLLCKNGIHL